MDTVYIKVALQLNKVQAYIFVQKITLHLLVVVRIVVDSVWLHLTALPPSAEQMTSVPGTLPAIVCQVTVFMPVCTVDPLVIFNVTLAFPHTVSTEQVKITCRGLPAVCWLTPEQVGEVAAENNTISSIIRNIPLHFGFTTENRQIIEINSFSARREAVQRSTSFDKRLGYRRETARRAMLDGWKLVNVNCCTTEHLKSLH